MTVNEAAKQYRAAGVAAARIRQGEKRPTDAEWTTKSAEPGEFRDGDNIGLIGEWLSDGGVTGRFLVCVDLDTPEANQRADEFLPDTRAIEGRLGKPRSHRWYFVTDVPDWGTSKAGQSAAAAAKAGKHSGPFKKQFRGANNSVHIDFIGSGGQAAVPPSRHTSGEVRAWEEGHGIEHAAVVPFETLWASVCGLAEAVGAKVPDVKLREKRLPPPEVAPPSPSPKSPRAPRVTGSHLATVRCDVPMGERVRRCREWLATAPLAVSGAGGHTTTFFVARRIVNDYLVTERDRAMDLTNAYNGRLMVAGEEPWGPADLKHKVDDAMYAPAEPKHPPGKVLLPPRVWNDPARLEDEFLTEHALRFLKDTAFDYRDGAYGLVSQECVRGRVWLFIEVRATADNQGRHAEWQASREQLRTQPGEHPKAAVEKLERLKKFESKPPKVVAAVTAAMVKNTVQAIRARRQLRDDTQLDTWQPPASGPSVLAVRNGLLDPVTRTLHPLSPDWFSTVKLSVAFNPQAPAPTKWLRFLSEVMEEDPERIAVIQEVFGACQDRDLQLKFFAAFVGGGDNGKSVVMSVLKSLLGSGNCSAVGLQELNANRFATFSLHGKLANLVGDQGYIESPDEGKLKPLTGGDLFTFEQKGRDTFSEVNKARIVFACNTMPTYGDKSEAIWNRLAVIPFTYTVPADRKNPAMLTEAYWTDEMPGILNWALEGLQRLREQRRFTRSVACEALKKQNRLDSNPARQFLMETCEYTGKEEDSVPVADLFHDYQKWCDTNGFTKKLTKPKFAKEVVSAFPKIEEGVPKRIGGTPARVRLGLRKRDNGSTVVGTQPAAAEATAPTPSEF